MSAGMPLPVVNPLRLGLDLQRPEPCILVIFGATGDLTRRKLAPALFHLGEAGLLPSPFSVIGVARRELSDDEFRQQMTDAVSQFVGANASQAPVWEEYLRHFYYLPSSFDDPGGYRVLEKQIQEVAQQLGGRRNRLFYLATPPDYFETIVTHLGAVGLAEEHEDRHEWARIIIEKPFGDDLESARALNQTITRVFREDQIYRIDHYLGKESVQNILAFRFANTIFEPIWNRQYIDHVQITVAEDIGVEGRGNYYEQAGALRDMVQSHLLALLSMVAMEPPSSMAADRLRDEKVQVLRSLRPIPVEGVDRYVVRGQYGRGWLAGSEVPAYREEQGVAPSSTVETYVALKLYIDSWRWGGVPFYLRTGKRLAKRVTEIALQFKPVPHTFFPDAPRDPNLLVIRIQPDEGILLRFAAKAPGLSPVIRPVNMEFFYNTAFLMAVPEAYETLLHDAMMGDASLFMRWDGVEMAWHFVMPILEAWSRNPAAAVPIYPAGTWGPPEAEALLAEDGRSWRKP